MCKREVQNDLGRRDKKVSKFTVIYFGFADLKKTLIVLPKYQNSKLIKRPKLCTILYLRVI